MYDKGKEKWKTQASLEKIKETLQPTRGWPWGERAYRITASQHARQRHAHLSYPPDYTNSSAQQSF